jgi:uncharacterized protein (DUF433 family)
MCEPISKKIPLHCTSQEEDAGIMKREGKVAHDAWNDRIESNPNILFGKPVVKGTRLAVDLIIELLSWGWSESDIMENYPGLTRDDIRACLGYAGATLRRCFSVSNEPIQ